MPVAQADAAASHPKAFEARAMKAASQHAAKRDVSCNSCPEKSLVAVLLCTYQGGRFLAEQLDSIRAQKHENVTVWASDDGSEDDTYRILEQYQELWGEGGLKIRLGPKEGYAANFLSLTCHPDIEADFFAYADQDDVWEVDKLSRAIAKLKQVPGNTPALYCARTRLIDEDGREIGCSPLFEKPPSFANALVQNIGGGNTMVMNKAARRILQMAGEKAVVSHDWWAYLLITAAGGTVIYDSQPTVRYRQHGANMVGSNLSWRARLLRVNQLFKNRLHNWITINTKALQEVRDLLTPENRRILDRFCAARTSWLFPRLWGIWRSGIYRQTTICNLGLAVAAVLKKL